MTPKMDDSGLTRALPDEVGEMVRKLKSLPSSICDPYCEGRCKQCPADVVRAAVSLIERLAPKSHIAADEKDTKLLRAFTPDKRMAPGFEIELKEGKLLWEGK